jgi:2-phospho-L-lactate/phosphoenolpyruvate guanylyltransferase
MRRSGIHAVIPVKSFASAKQRLSPFLNSPERAHLARLMFEDVLDALGMARQLRGCLVVTHDAQAAAIARKSGVQVVDANGDSGFSVAVSCATAALPPGSGMLVVPTDVPQVSPALVDLIAALTPSPGLTLVPATSDGGTNLLAMRPCTLLPPLFGRDSFARHRRAAAAAGITPVIWPSSDAGLDLDRPADLAAFLAMKSATRAHRFLAGLDLPMRFEAMHAARHSLAVAPA